MNVVLYTVDYCPYCIGALKLLDTLNIEYKNIDLSDKPEELAQLKKDTGMPTVPQIFIKENLIGGFTELEKLHLEGQLENLVS